MNEDNIRDLLREMRDEPVPAESLARVRFGIGERLWQRSRWRMVKWVTACAAMLVAAIFIQYGTRPPVTVHLQSIAAVAPPPPPAQTVTARPAIRRRAIRRTKHAAESIVIRMETADPDVVIMLVSNDQSERNQN
jgi:hypothetical protein